MSYENLVSNCWYAVSKDFLAVMICILVFQDPRLLPWRSGDRCSTTSPPRLLRNRYSTPLSNSDIPQQLAQKAETLQSNFIGSIWWSWWVLDFEVPSHTRRLTLMQPKLFPFNHSRTPFPKLIYCNISIGLYVILDTPISCQVPLTKHSSG